eukprot:Skav222995  [mRNA]  locus=scaffold1827:282542:283725:- [translate_table: standard]
MTAHFAFCVCILLVLQPLRAFRGNQESHLESAEFEATTFLPGSSQAKKIEDLEKQVAELKASNLSALDSVFSFQRRSCLASGWKSFITHLHVFSR